MYHGIFTEYEAKIRQRVHAKWYYQNNKGKAAERAKKFKKKNPNYSNEWGRKNPEKKRKIYTKAVLKLKETFFTMYGTLCACCGETERKFLTLDHIHGGGRQENKSGGGGQKIYRNAVKSLNKEKYRVLCFNCNCASYFSKRCPHNQIETIIDQYINSKKNKDG